MGISTVLAVAAAAAAASVASAFGPRCPPNKAAITRGAPVYNGPLVPNLKIAFIGDTGNNEVRSAPPPRGPRPPLSPFKPRLSTAPPFSRSFDPSLSFLRRTSTSSS